MEEWLILVHFGLSCGGAKHQGNGLKADVVAQNPRAPFFLTTGL